MSGRGSGRKRKAPPTGRKHSKKAVKKEKVEKEREEGYDGSTESDGDGVEQGSGQGTLYAVVGVIIVALLYSFAPNCARRFTYVKLNKVPVMQKVNTCLWTLC